MISLIEAKNYRCLKYVKQSLGPYHILVGPNAAGKTTFLDVISFMGALVSKGLDEAIGERSPNFRDLVWNRAADSFELAIEAVIPDSLRKLVSEGDADAYDRIRYEVVIGLNEDDAVSIHRERAVLRRGTSSVAHQRLLFPELRPIPDTIFQKKVPDSRNVFNKTPNGNDNYYSERYRKKGKGWKPSYKLGPKKSTFGNLVDDEKEFPVSTWLKSLLTGGVEQIILNSQHIRKPSPPGQGRGFKPDGSNLPWVIEDLRTKHPQRFKDWIAHVQSALPNINDVTTYLSEHDYHRTLVICYEGGLEAPSWMCSDGTLRLLALTLPAYLPSFDGVYLVEEPENGIHPKAVESLIQSLSSVYSAQVLLASHSPVILSATRPDQVLCFAKNDQGATDIVRGDEHPKLQNWKAQDDFGVLFAAGVLG